VILVGISAALAVTLARPAQTSAASRSSAT
jgi:hypothetical protein